jgi:hypothetical protein
VSYDEFEPWYTKGEWLYQVHGIHGEDPTEGYCSKQYPWPAVSHEPRVQQISDALAEGGYHPFHAPVGILLNGSDQVGRNYMYHNIRAIVALGKESNDTVFQKTLGLNDFYLAGNGREWPLGNIQMLGKSNALAMKGEEPKLTKLAPKWSLEEVARRAVDFWLTTEDLPTPDNRVTVDGDGHVHLAYRATNDTEADGL